LGFDALISSLPALLSPSATILTLATAIYRVDAPDVGDGALPLDVCPQSFLKRKWVPPYCLGLARTISRMNSKA